ncbi:hypothetical protein [Caenibius sp. WL]|uniref:hypothetical protein n=1 Tax=Caenibius sp. WL TaxID=2872646 RepID=UPI001C9922F3|nr:hypothetical protein [Caenibius sp. WL]QZP06831.1 hypothetical protein K5X80_08825 [Caenibius sp. WL]
MNIIQSITAPEPMREGEYPIMHIVGMKSGGHVVTNIEYRVENYGDHGLAWYDVFAGDILIESMAARDVGSISYQTPQVPE